MSSAAQARLVPIHQTLILRGPCPSKKNLYRRAKNGAMFLNAEVKARLDSLTIQARSQWGCQPPVMHPDMDVTFYFSSGRPDRDNRLTAILDCLQDAGVLVNDNSKNCNGIITIQPAHFVGQGKEKVEVQIRA